jgi:hypothetical protein
VWQPKTMQHHEPRCVIHDGLQSSLGGQPPPFLHLSMLTNIGRWPHNPFEYYLVSLDHIRARDWPNRIPAAMFLDHSTMGTRTVPGWSDELSDDFHSDMDFPKWWLQTFHQRWP